MPNQGQTHPQVQFETRALGGRLFFTQDELVMALPSGSAALSETHALSTTVVRMRFDGANQSATLMGNDLLPGVVNYLLGNDPRRWQTGLPTYATPTVPSESRRGSRVATRISAPWQLW